MIRSNFVAIALILILALIGGGLGILSRAQGSATATLARAATKSITLENWISGCLSMGATPVPNASGYECLGSSNYDTFFANFSSENSKSKLTHYENPDLYDAYYDAAYKLILLGYLGSSSVGGGDPDLVAFRAAVRSFQIKSKIPDSGYVTTLTQEKLAKAARTGVLNTAHDNDPTGDLCLNIPGVQTTIPMGYIRVLGKCFKFIPISSISLSDLPNTNKKDVCLNIPGIQSTVPAGYQLIAGQCIPLSHLWIYGVAGYDPNQPTGSQYPQIVPYPIPLVFNTINGSVWSMVATGWSQWPTSGLSLMNYFGIANGLYFDNKLWQFGRDSQYAPALQSSDGLHWNTVPAYPWYPKNNYVAAVHTPPGGVESVYIVGGDNPNVLHASGNALMTSEVWASVDGLNWVQKTSNAPWVGRERMPVISFNNKLWVLGGAELNGSGSCCTVNNDVWSSDDGVNWTMEIANADWQARSLHSALVYNGKLWVMGGWGSGCNNYYCSNGSGALSDIWSSDDGVHWSLVTNTPGWAINGHGVLVGRAAHCSVVYNNKMYVIGGYYTDINTPLSNGSTTYSTPDVWSSIDGINWTKEADFYQYFYEDSSSGMTMMQMPICAVAPF